MVQSAATGLGVGDHTLHHSNQDTFESGRELLLIFTLGQQVQSRTVQGCYNRYLPWMWDIGHQELIHVGREEFRREGGIV